MSSKAGKPSEHVVRVGPKDAKPGREVRPVLGPSDAPLATPAPLTLPGPGETYGRPDGTRPQLHGAADAVQGAPLAPPPEEARDGLMLSVDAAGGYVVPKQLDGAKKPGRH